MAGFGRDGVVRAVRPLVNSFDEHEAASPVYHALASRRVLAPGAALCPTRKNIDATRLIVTVTQMSLQSTTGHPHTHTYTHIAAIRALPSFPYVLEPEVAVVVVIVVGIVVVVVVVVPRAVKCIIRPFIA
uniref:Uncharacterized protein n=1 Tax=Plectus sambesii TaxID=2011161 RepID=A0A914X549_9BILA